MNLDSLAYFQSVTCSFGYECCESFHVDEAKMTFPVKKREDVDFFIQEIRSRIFLPIVSLLLSLKLAQQTLNGCAKIIGSLFPPNIEVFKSGAKDFLAVIVQTVVLPFIAALSLISPLWAAQFSGYLRSLCDRSVSPLDEMTFNPNISENWQRVNRVATFILDAASACIDRTADFLVSFITPSKEESWGGWAKEKGLNFVAIFVSPFNPDFNKHDFVD